MQAKTHNWSFFRAGGVTQVELKSKEDLLQLRELDQKLWMALAMPVQGLSLDSQTLSYLDSDQDGKIRPPEILAAIQWIDEQLHDLSSLWQEGPALALSQIKQPLLLAAATRVLQVLDLSSQQQLSLAELTAALDKLKAQPFNGDGVIVPSDQDEHDLLLRQIMACQASVLDRSGEQGINRAILEAFFAALPLRLTWLEEGERGFGRLSLADAKSLDQATARLEAKLDEYFYRCQWLRFDASSLPALATENSPLSGEAAKEDFAKLPLAKLNPELVLLWSEPVHPLYEAELQDWRTLLSATAYQSALEQGLCVSDWQALQRDLQSYRLWQKAECQTALQGFSLEEIRRLLQGKARLALEELLSFDEAVAPEFAVLVELDKLLRFHQSLLPILRNYVNFADFYQKKGAIFQVGSLYLDGRSSELCMDVTHKDRHISMAGLSGAFLLYCELHRAGKAARQIVALMTDGDSDNLIVGRNGVFYDQEGQDWDATIVRIQANPISLREAFWTPYKKLIRFVEEQIAKRVAAAENTQTLELSQTAEAVSQADKKSKEAGGVIKKVDVGTVAALGVALGSISTFFGLILSRFLDLGIFMPFGILGLMLLVSGPSMFLAFLKLKSRNLGPILDANGWAINTVARINVPFAASLTQIRKVPLQGAELLKDPFAEKGRPWKIYACLALLVFAFLAYKQGKLDRYLPESWHSQQKPKLSVSP